jgi:hypothetical protein
VHPVQLWRQAYPEALVLSVPESIDVIAEYIIRCEKGPQIV